MSGRIGNHATNREERSNGRMNVVVASRQSPGPSGGITEETGGVHGSAEIGRSRAGAPVVAARLDRAARGRVVDHAGSAAGEDVLAIVPRDPEIESCGLDGVDRGRIRGERVAPD